MSERLPEIDLQPLRPWPWKRLLRWAASVLGLFLAGFVWAMHRPWGDPVAGVRLEPLHSEEVRPESFCALLQQACVEYQRNPLSGVAQEQSTLFIKRKAPPWSETEYPELNTFITAHAGTLQMLEKAVAQPIESSFIPASSDFSTSWYGPLMSVIKLMDAKGFRSLQANEWEGVHAVIKTELKLVDRLANAQSMMQALVCNSINRMTHRLVRRAAIHTKDPAELDALQRLLAADGLQRMNMAEMFRGELAASLLYHRVSPNEAIPAGLRPLLPLIGSEASRREANLRVVYSEVIAALEQSGGKTNPAEVIRKHTDGTWKMWLKPDPVTRLALAGAVRSWERMCPELGHDANAQHRVSLTVIALQRYLLQHGHWPQTLTEAMPQVPLDPFTEDLQPIQYTIYANPDRWFIKSGVVTVESDEVEQAQTKLLREQPKQPKSKPKPKTPENVETEPAK